MNAVSIFALSVLGHITALAQGTIDFRNHVDDVQPKVDAPFFDQRGVPLEGSNYVAQLYIWYPYPEYHFIPVGRKAVFMTNGYFQATNFQDVTVELPPPFQRGARVWIQV